MKRGRRGLMVMALDCGAGGREFKPRRFQNIFDLMERFDKSVCYKVIQRLRVIWRRLDQDQRGCIYEKGSENWFELETRLNGQRQKMQ